MPETSWRFVKEWVVPILAAVVTALSLYGWLFEAQFNREVNKALPEMRREVHEIVDNKAVVIERDRLQELRKIDQRLSRIETLLEQLKEK